GRSRSVSARTLINPLRLPIFWAVYRRPALVPAAWQWSEPYDGSASCDKARGPVHEGQWYTSPPGVTLFRQRPHKSFADAQPRLQQKGVVVGNRLLEKGFHLLPGLCQVSFALPLLRGLPDLRYPPLPVLEFAGLFELYL